MTRSFQAGTKFKGLFEILGGLFGNNIDIWLRANPIGIRPCWLSVRVLAFRPALSLLNCRIAFNEFLARLETLADDRSFPEGCEKGASGNVYMSP